MNIEQKSSCLIEARRFWLPVEALLAIPIRRFFLRKIKTMMEPVAIK